MKDEPIKEKYYRVTEVLSPFTGIEFVPKDILQKAGDRGTAVHKMIESALREEFSFASDETQPYFDSWTIFWEANQN